MCQRLASLSLVAALGLFTACGGESTKAADSSSAASKPGADLGAKVKHSVDSAKDKLAVAREEYTATLDEKLKQLDVHIAKLKEEASSASGEAKDKMNELVKSLDAKRQTAASKLGEWKSIGADKWQDFTTELNTLVGDLQHAVENALPKDK